MTGFMILIGLTLLFLIFLVAESVLHNRRLMKIPLRITVTGTRGKSSIVRTLASVLRAHGIRVLAKTTGSEAMYILPDGTTEKINRKGLTTILEQKKLITKAVRLNAGCIITEIMSIHPNNHTIETQKLIKPGITVISNLRVDHTDVTGESLHEISELFTRDIYPGSKVFIPAEECNTFISKGTDQKKARLLIAGTGTSDELRLDSAVFHTQVRTNLDLVTTAALDMEIPARTIIKGIKETRLDIGQLEIFRFHTPNRKIWFVNTFAANDPVSTIQMMSKTIEIITPEISSEPEITGLLALRSDRGERSRQWLDFLQSNERSPFSRLFVSGLHSAVFTRRLNNCKRLRTSDPEKITRLIIESTAGDTIVFGIMNIHGLGRQLIEYWKTGTAVSCNPTDPEPANI